mgnify:CR=1 FL=1
MRITTVLMLPICIFAGCAISPDRAATFSDYDVCKWYQHPNTDPQSRLVLENESKSRYLTCQSARYYGVSPSDIALQQQQGMQMMQQGLQIMNPQQTYPTYQQQPYEQQYRSPTPSPSCVVKCAELGHMSSYCDRVCSYSPAPY